MIMLCGRRHCCKCYIPRERENVTRTKNDFRDKRIKSGVMAFLCRRRNDGVYMTFEIMGSYDDINDLIIEEGFVERRSSTSQSYDSNCWVFWSDSSIRNKIVFLFLVHSLKSYFNNRIIINCSEMFLTRYH